MSKKHSTTPKGINQAYSDKLRKIRPLVDFDMDLRSPLSRWEKARITKYYGILLPKLREGHYLFRPRNKEHLAAAKRAEGLDKVPLIRAVPVKAFKQNKPRIDFPHGEMRIRNTFVSSQYIPLDAYQLAGSDPAAYINAKLAKLHGDRFQIICGINTNGTEKIIPGEPTKKLTAAQILKLMHEYNQPESNNYWANWLTGIRLVKTSNQASSGKYRNSQSKARRQRKSYKGYGSHRGKRK